MPKLHSFTLPQKGEKSVLAKIGQHLKFCIKPGKAGEKHADLLIKDYFKFSLQLLQAVGSHGIVMHYGNQGVKTLQVTLYKLELPVFYVLLTVLN